MMDFSQHKILIRGAGELASGVAWVLAKSGFPIVMTEISQPLMVRWPVSFGTAIYTGEWTVEGITSQRVQSAKDAEDLWRHGIISVMVDPELKYLDSLRPSVVIDAILAKRNLGTTRMMAPLTLALGPGFYAGRDVDIVIETNRGHNLARLIYQGEAEANTGVPGEIGGLTMERVLYSACAGTFKAYKSIGEFVTPNMVLGEIVCRNSSVPLVAPIHGVLRGLVRDGLFVPEKTKLGDIDPRGVKQYCWTISEKARAIGLAALFGIVQELKNRH